MQSLFIMSNTGEVIIEKHWRAVISRTVCDAFWSEVTKAPNHRSVPPIITTPRHYLAHIFVDGLFFLSVIGSEISPLLCIDFMLRISSTFESYFGKVSSETLKQNFVTVYQLLDEMMDDGFPLNTEPNVLQEMVMKPTLLAKVIDSLSNNPSSVSSRLPEGTISSIPWRRKNVRYAHNEIYFDIVESYDCIVNSNGQTVHSCIWGEILCESKLSGTPDLILEVNDPSLLEDVSFHPCVRYNRFLKTKQLSFVPPDGNFTLCTYSNSRDISPPLYVKPQVTIDEKGERMRVEMLVGSRFVGEKPLQGIVVTIHFGKGLSSSSFTSNVGSAHFDEISKSCTWSIGSLSKNVTPQLSGTLRPTDKSVDWSCSPVVQVQFKLPKETLSTLKIQKLDITNEKYKPYQAMRSVSKSGTFEVRC